MSGSARSLDYRAIGAVVVVAVLFRVIAWRTGFGDWVDRTPTVAAACHALGVLFFGALGVFALIGGRYDPKMRSWGYRLVGIVSLIVAIANAVLLFSGKANFF